METTMKSMSKTKNVNWLLLSICVISPIVVGWIVGMISGSGNGYGAFNRPFFTPPNIVFAIVWPILYFMMGLSLYFILMNKPTSQEGINLRRTSIGLWFAQIIINLSWPFFFFTFKLQIFAFVWIVLLLALVSALFVINLKINKVAAFLLLPYMVWLAFAAYLNLMIVLFN